MEELAIAGIPALISRTCLVDHVCVWAVNLDRMRRKLRIQSTCTVEVRRQELRVQFPLRENPETESGQRVSIVCS